MLFSFNIAVGFILSATASIEFLRGSQSETLPCETDLRELCGMDYPSTQQTIYSSRMCLWQYHEKLTEDCFSYLVLDNPSIVEPCYEQITAHCQSITPGDYRIHNCLQEQAQTIPEKCRVALEADKSYDDNSDPEESTSTVIGEDDYYYYSDDVVSDYNDDVEEVNGDDDSNPDIGKSDNDSFNKLFDVFVLQDLLRKMVAMPAMFPVQDYLAHLTVELGDVENWLFKSFFQQTLDNEATMIDAQVVDDDNAVISTVDPREPEPAQGYPSDGRWFSDDKERLAERLDQVRSIGEEEMLIADKELHEEYVPLEEPELHHDQDRDLVVRLSQEISSEAKRQDLPVSKIESIVNSVSFKFDRFLSEFADSILSTFQPSRTPNLRGGHPSENDSGYGAITSFNSMLQEAARDPRQ